MLLVPEISLVSQMTPNMWRPSLVRNEIKIMLFKCCCFVFCGPGGNWIDIYLNQTVWFRSWCILFSAAAKCIDHYTKLRVENAELPEDEEKKVIDPRLEGIVNKMFLRCLDDHKYKQAIGIALETRRLDIFEKTILESVCWHLSFIYVLNNGLLWNMNLLLNSSCKNCMIVCSDR